jgi:type IV secretion system protein VirB6
MGFFAEFSRWLNTMLSTYIGDNTARIAAILEPAIVSLAVLYVAVWGYLQLMGKVEEPFLEGVKRLMTLAVILGVSLQLWLFNSLIVDTFFNAPAELAAGIVGAPDSVSTVDQLLFDGDDAGRLLMEKGGIFDGNFSFYLAGAAVYLIVGLTAVYTMFLLALSKIALSVLIALGPLFFACLLFESTKRFFESWIAQMANYGFVTILTVLVATLMMQVVSAAARQAVAVGGGIQFANAVQVCIAAALTFLIMKQVPPMAAGLASGIALSSFGAVSSAISWGLSRARGTGKQAGQFSRGLLMDRETTRWDSLSRKAGYHAQRGIRRLARRDHSIRRARPA